MPKIGYSYYNANGEYITKIGGELRNMEIAEAWLADLIERYDNNPNSEFKIKHFIVESDPVGIDIFVPDADIDVGSGSDVHTDHNLS